ncbi:S-layer homology domain-containing protein [Phormidium tenue FACHB-886]|nr:S-layer homology domain-containing protein [Phormidium tenue FACHB-886]
MTNLPPSDPRRNRDLGFDEFIALLVAFGAIGAVLWWGLSRNEAGFDVGNLLPSSETATPLNDLFTTPDEAASQAAGITSAQREGQLQTGVVDPTLSPTPGSPDRPLTSPTTPTVVAPAVVPAPVPVGEAASPPVTTETEPTPVLVVPSATASPVEFSDVPQNYWARPFIAALAQRGIIKGFEDGTFQPDQPVSRAQYAALIETIFQPQAVQSPIAFKDIPANFWASPAINTSVRTGFLKGYPEGVFLPNQPMPRVEVLASLVNGLQLSQPSAPADIVERYRDSDQIPGWAVPVVAAATENRMVVNYPAPEALNPNQPTTRAEVSALLYQALVAADKIEPIGSSYIVQP